MPLISYISVPIRSSKDETMKYLRIDLNTCTSTIVSMYDNTPLGSILVNESTSSEKKEEVCPCVDCKCIVRTCCNETTCSPSDVTKKTSENNKPSCIIG